MTSKQEAIISGEQIKNMLLGAYKSFEKNYQYINDLNVFPVPDGDTGTNMMHTRQQWPVRSVNCRMRLFPK